MRTITLFLCFSVLLGQLSTQGADPQARARRRPGLIWAVTMFDFRLAPVPGQTEDLMRKDHIAMANLTKKQVIGKGVLAVMADHLAVSKPYMKFLAAALELEF